MILKLVTLLVLFHVMDACEQYAFKIKEDHELQDHVITTMTTPFMEVCWAKCVWMMNCLSINVRNTMFGTVECDLNNSSNKASPDSFIKRQGTQFHQMKSNVNCKIYECKLKKAMEDGWFKYNGKLIQLFIENKTWTEARAHCLSLRGDLLSIKTQYESDFYHEVTKLTPKNTSLHDPTPWIGYNALNSADFQWSDGTRIQYYALMPGWDIIVQKCVAFKNGREWIATSCDEKREYFCETPVNQTIS